MTSSASRGARKVRSGQAFWSTHWDISTWALEILSPSLHVTLGMCLPIWPAVSLCVQE